jgi:hypothetical protein
MEKKLEVIVEEGKKLGELWAENRLPKEALEVIPPEKWEECVKHLHLYPRAKSLLTKWGDTKGWEKWMLSCLSIFCEVQLYPTVPDIEGVADRFLRRKANISDLRAAVKEAKK